jgi:PIN domain nuclease of toxin-antitoxin system
VILLDTHAWVWWLSEPSALSRGATRAIEKASSEGRVVVSTISTWELALLVARGRVALRLPVDEWVRASEALPELSFLSPSNRVMVESAALPGTFHTDPADRMIVATARVHGLTVVTKDEKILRYPHVESVW